MQENLENVSIPMYLYFHKKRHFAATFKEKRTFSRKKIVDSDFVET